MDHRQFQLIMDPSSVNEGDAVEAAIAYELEQMEMGDLHQQLQLIPPLESSSSLVSYQQPQLGQGAAGGVGEGPRPGQPQLTAFSQSVINPRLQPSGLRPISSMCYPQQYPHHSQMQMVDYRPSSPSRELMMMEERMRGVAPPYPYPVGTEGAPGTGQIPYYPPQQPPPNLQEHEGAQQHQVHVGATATSGGVVHQAPGSEPGQLGSPQGSRNIYDIGRQLVADKISSRNQAAGNPTSGTSSGSQFQQQQQGGNVFYPPNYPAGTATAASPVQPPFSESGSQPIQRPSSQSVIRHTQEFIPNNEAPELASPSPVRGKNISLKTTRMPRIRAPPRKPNAQIIQRPLQFTCQSSVGPSPANPCFPTPAAVPATYQPYAQPQHPPQFATTSWRGTYQQQLPGRPQPVSTDSIPVVEIDDSDEEETIIEMTAFGQTVTRPKQGSKIGQKQKRPSKEHVPLEVVVGNVLPTTNIVPTQNMLREHLLSPTKRDPSSGSVIGVSPTNASTTGQPPSSTLSPAATLPDTHVKKKRSYTPRRKKQLPPTQEQAAVLADAGSAAVPTTEQGEVPPVKPKRKYVRKPKPPKEPPAGVCDGVPLGSNKSQIIDDPLSGNTNAQAQVQEEMVPEIPISNDPGINLQSSPPPKRARGRGGGGPRGRGRSARDRDSGSRGHGRGRGRPPKKKNLIQQSSHSNEQSTCRIDVNDSLLVDVEEKVIQQQQESISDEVMEDDTNIAECDSIIDEDVKTTAAATAPLLTPDNDNQNMAPGNLVIDSAENHETQLSATAKIENDTDQDLEKDSNMVNMITTEMASMTTNTHCDGAVREEKESVDSGNEVKMEADDEDTLSYPQSASSSVKRKHPQILSSAGEDSDSVPYGERLKQVKRTESTNSQSKATSSVTGSENDGAPRRSTRSRTAALHSKQSGGSSEGLSSAKRKLQYDESESSSDGEWADHKGSSDDETTFHNGHTSANHLQASAPRGRTSNFGRGRGRGRGRPLSRVSVVKNRVMKSAKDIARKMTNGMPAKFLKPKQGRTDYQDADEEEYSGGEENNMASVGNWPLRLAAERAFRIKSCSSLNFRPQYTDAEKEILYGDQHFVIDVQDINKTPDNVFIWQINEKGRYLRQFYPAKFAGRQFHSSSPTMWYFLEEDFRSEAFNERFQPIYTVVASRKVCFKETKYADEMVEQVVQYVYIDKLFFARMAKNLGMIHTLNLESTFRTAFIDSLPVYTMVCIIPTFISGVTANPDYEGHKKFRRYIEAWKCIDVFTFNMLQTATGVTEMKNNGTIDLISYLPHMSYSGINVNKNVLCSACMKRTPIVTVQFSQTENNPRPYNPFTLQPLPPPHTVKPPSEPLYWCKSCSIAAKRFHRFYHFRYFLHRLVKQNLARDMAIFRESNAEVSDALLIWIMMTEKSWQNAMFLDFMVCTAEMHAEFGPPTAMPPQAFNMYTCAAGADDQFQTKEMTSAIDVDMNASDEQFQTNATISAADMSAIDELIALPD